MKVLTGLMWFRIWSRGRLVWTRYRNFRFRKTQ